jgi:hypothetical protein
MAMMNCLMGSGWPPPSWSDILSFLFERELALGPVIWLPPLHSAAGRPASEHKG